MTHATSGALLLGLLVVLSPVLAAGLAPAGLATPELAPAESGATASSASLTASAATVSPAATASPVAAVSSAGAASPGATASPASIASPAALAEPDAPGVERDGQEVVLAIPADRMNGNATAPLTVGVADLAAADGAAEDDGGGEDDAAENENAATTNETAYRRGDRYVATVSITDLVGPGVEADLSNATVRATHAGDVVLEDAVDLRYLAATGDPSFDGATLAVPVDARGLGTTNASLVLAEQGRFASGDRNLAGTIDGVGPAATLRVSPDLVADLDLRATYGATVLTGGDAVPGAEFDLTVLSAAAEASRIAYRDGEPVLVQPLLHPEIGPERVELRVSTGSPDGLYVHTGADERGVTPVPATVAAAGDRRVRVHGGGQTLLGGVATGVERRDSVRLRIENGSLSAPRPAALEPYDAIVLHDDGVAYLPIEERLRANETQPLPEHLREVDRDARAVLVGADERPATVDLTVVVPEDGAAETNPTVPTPEPDADEFLGIWADVGDGVVLLLLAMAGSFVPVAAAFAFRIVRPGASATAGARAVVLHFTLGGLAGVAAIASVQALWAGPLLPTLRIVGLELGIGALLVGSVYGGIVGGALRVGLGTAGLWPESYVAGGPTVPVLVTVTDDDGNALPGEQTVEARRPGIGGVLQRATVGGSTAELELTPGEYGVVARTGERETDTRMVAVPTPERTVPEAVELDLTVARPGLQVEVTDAETGASVETASVTVTTDGGKTKRATATEGTARLALPVETGTVTIVVDAEGYERRSVEQALDEQLRTVDVGLEPVRGDLVATARIDGVATGGVGVRVAPRGDDPAAIGVRTAELETDEDGRASTELPVGAYALRMQLAGANADLFEFATVSADVGADDATAVDVPARFRWEPSESLRERDAELRSTIRSVATEATADPTIPLYFASVAAELLDVFEALPDAGHEFATAAIRPDAVAAASIDAARATLAAVGAAMQEPAVRRVLTASDADPERVSPDLDASPAAMLEYLGQDVTVATVEARAERVRERVAEAESSVATVAPVRAIVEVALQLPQGADASLQQAGREYAALRLLDAAEELFEHDALRRRLAAVPAEE